LAVTAFFAVSFIGLFYGLTPFTCCKRAFLCAAAIYLAASIAVNIVNAILTSAIIESHTNKQKETQRAG